jgi:hypothetical protein
MCSVNKIRDRIEKGGKDKRTGRNKRMKAREKRDKGNGNGSPPALRPQARPRAKPRARLAPRTLGCFFFTYPKNKMNKGVDTASLVGRGNEAKQAQDRVEDT